MMKKLIYPAIFHEAEEGGFWVSFPDFPECLTQGEDAEESYEKAVDVLGFALDDMEKSGQAFPKASSPENIKIEDGTIKLIEVDLEEYKRNYSC